jgi:hypothetical protein
MFAARNFWRNQSRAVPLLSRNVYVVLNGTTGNRCESFRTYGPYATMLNDITFDTFHLFHADSHMLTGFSTAPE